jgi:hypothetical protein
MYIFYLWHSKYKLYIAFENKIRNQSLSAYALRTLENTEWAIEVDNPQNLATYSTQDEDKQNKNTMLWLIYN